MEFPDRTEIVCVRALGRLSTYSLLIQMSTHFAWSGQESPPGGIYMEAEIRKVRRGQLVEECWGKVCAKVLR